MLLQLHNIKKYFPIKRGFLGQAQEYVKAVDNVDLSMEEGENVGIVGESGSGKTTLGRVILKLYSATAGSIVLDRTDITGLSQKKMRPLRKYVQMVFQDPYSSLDPRFTIRSIFQEAMTVDKSLYKTKEDKVKRIEELLSAVNLTEDILDRYPHEFSGGERQRIAIARALVMNPKLLILDEAVSSLDVLVQEQIINLLIELQEQYKLTYLFISHNLRVVRRISSKIAVMYNGRIVELASTEEIFSNPLHPYTKELLSAALNYKSIKREQEFKFDEGARLIDTGNGHFVLVNLDTE